MLIFGDFVQVYVLPQMTTLKASIFPIKGKNNNQLLVSDGDREIPTISKPCLWHYPLPWGLDFSICIGD